MRGLCKRLLAAGLLAASCLAAAQWNTRRETVLHLGFFAGSYWDAPNANTYAIIDDVIARFEESHPGVRVTYQSGILKQDYSEWLTEQYLQGDAPDIFMVLPEDFGRLAELGALAPLDAWLAEREAAQPDSFYPAALACGQIDGVQYAMPYESVPTLMFVNTTLLAAEGIDLPRAGWTWDDFYQICAAVTRDADGDGSLDQFGSYDYTWKNALDANGVQLFDPSGESCTLASPPAVEAIAFAQKLQRLHNGAEISARAFDEGRVAFRPFLFSDYRTYQPYPWRIKRYAHFGWDCVEMPRGPQGSNSSALSTVLVGIRKGAHRQPLVTALLEELTGSVQTQSMIYSHSHGASALRAATESPQTRAYLGQDTPSANRPDIDLLTEVMENATASVRFPQYAQVMLLADRLVPEAMESGQLLELQLMLAQREMNLLLQS